MNNKLKFLTKYSLKKKFNSKWFRVVNILLLICIPLICNIDSIIKLFGGDFNEPVNIHVIDNVGVYEKFKSVYENTNNISLNDNEVIFNEYLEDDETLKKSILEEEKKDIIIEINRDAENIYDVKIITYDLVDTMLYQGIVNALNSTKSTIALGNYNIDEEVLSNINKEIDVERIILNEEANTNSEMMQLIGGVLVPIFIVPFFFLIMLVIQYVGAEINEEKTSKSMEIIISSVSPTTHFLAKIISTNVFVVLQAALLLVYGFVGAISRMIVSKEALVTSLGTNTSDYINTFIESGMLSNILKAFPFIIILLVLSFLAYSLVAGILASVTTNAEDYQQIQTPMMLLLVFGYYLSIVASLYDSSVFIKIASYIPLISSILSPVLLVQGQVGIIDVIISTLLLLGLVLLLIKYGIKIYKTGILNYSSSKLWKKMANAIKNK